jgi:SNF2 family DNA or RNA helicase
VVNRRRGHLIEEMGLEKTLSLLALICSSLDTLKNQKSRAHSGMASLIVTPISSMCEFGQFLEVAG